MTNAAIYKILAMPEFCNRNRIYGDFDMNGFSFKWALRVLDYFKDEPAAMSITYPARLCLDGEWHDGELEVMRDGRHAVRMSH